MTARYNQVVCDICGKCKDNVREWEPRPGGSYISALTTHLECPSCRKYVNKYRLRYRFSSRFRYETKEIVKEFKRLGRRTKEQASTKTGWNEGRLNDNIVCAFCMELATLADVIGDEVIRCFHCNRALCYQHAIVTGNDNVWDCPDCAIKQHYLGATSAVIDTHTWNKAR